MFAINDPEQRDTHLNARAVDMDNDDELTGRLLSRREVISWMALMGAGAMVGCDRTAAAAGHAELAAEIIPPSGLAATSMPACIVRPEMTVGPYFVDKQLDRSDVRTDPTTSTARPGTPVELTFNIADVTGGKCAPLAGAMIDIWHCDASGVYSGVNDERFGDTSGQQWLRGYQRTDANGMATFTTVYPGWYEGRAVHIHFKVRTKSATDTAYEFTSQLFFDESTTDRVHAMSPYVKTGRRVRNTDDGIYGSVGDQMLLTLAPRGASFTAAFGVGLDLANAAVGRADSDFGPGGPGGPGGPPPGARRGPPPGGRRPGGPPPGGRSTS
jgi:protocatechuate 3,4-dioxygenase beta subunit